MRRLGISLVIGCALAACSTTGPSPRSTGAGENAPVGGSGSVRAGVPFTLYTHCGLGGLIDFDGSHWDVLGPADDGNGNPPPGFGNPHDEGTIRLLSRDHAEFVSSQGVTVLLARRDEPKVVEPCA